MAKSNTIQFKGTFDGSQILNELKKVRASMSEAGASDTLFKNVDKDIVATEKLINDMMAQIQKGFSNTKEISAFEKQINKLQTNFLKISTGLKGANLSENFTFNSPEIAKLTQEINRLIAAQDRLKESSKNALATAGHNIGFNQDDVKEIQKAIDANEDLEESLIRVAKAKEKAAKANAGQTGMATDAGKEYIAKAKAGLSLEDLGATAMSGKTAKGPDDARARGTGGKLKGTRDKRRLDEDKAMAAVNETYQQALEETVRNGGSAVDAIEAMKKALADYGVQLSNTERLQENFAESLEGFYTGDIVGVGQKSAVTKAQKAGRTNAQGEFELSDDARRQIVNNSQITAYNKNLEQVSQKEKELAIERDRLLEQAVKKQQEHNNAIKQADQNINEATDSYRKNAAASREAGESQEKLNNSFDNMKDAVKTFLSISSAVNGLKNVVQDTFNDIQELDKSFASIAMVTDYSVGEMWESYDQYADMAERLGQKTSDVIKASGLFYQQGLDTAESLELTNDTLTLATLAGSDFETATEQMTAALRGFHMEMDEGTRVTDVYSELAAKAAADVDGIAYAISKTASIANNAGMSFENTSAFLTQMIETTQEAPENLGTAMKTIIARFTELKENVAGTDKSEFDDLDYNKVDTALKSVGISLKDANGQFRDLDDVFLELSSKWNTLDRNSQRYVATIAAGSRQQSRFIAMMENYERTMELVDVAQNASGKSAEQFAKSQDTVEAKMNKISTAWEQLRVSFLDSEVFKNALDLVKDLVTAFGNMDFSQIATLGIVGLTLGKSIITNFIKGIQSGASSVSSAIEVVKTQIANEINKKRGKQNLFKITYSTEGIEKFTQELQEAGIEHDKLSTKQKQMLLTYAQMPLEIKESTAEINEQRVKLMSLDEEQLDRLVTENKITEEIRQQVLNYQRLQAEIMKTNSAEQARQAGNALRNINSSTGENSLGNRGNYGQQLGTKGQVVSEGLTSGLTTAFMVAIGGGDLSDALSAGLGAAFTSVIPMVLNKLVPKLISFIGTKVIVPLVAAVGAIPLAIGAAVVGTIGLIIYCQKQVEKARKAQHEAELNRLKNLKKITNDLLDKQIASLKEAMDKRKQKTSLEKSVSTINQLSNKAFLTEQENTELEEAKSNLNDNFSEVVTSFDENSGQIVLNTAAIDHLTEKLEEEAVNAEQQARFYQAQGIDATIEAREKSLEVADYFKRLDISSDSQSKGSAKSYIGEFNEDEYAADFIEVSYDVSQTKSGESVTWTGKSFKDWSEVLLNAYDEDSGVFKGLSLENEDLENWDSFQKYLDETGISLDNFAKKVSQLAKEEIAEDAALLQARESAKQEYLLQDIDGEAVSEELANALTFTIDEEDLSKNFSEDNFHNKITTGYETNKNWVRDYLQDMQQGNDLNTSGNAGIYKNMQSMEIGDTNAHEIIESKMKEWEENEEQLMSGFDGNLAEWTELPVEFTKFLETEYAGKYTADNWEDVRKNAEQSKKITEDFFYNLILSEMEGFGEIKIEDLSESDRNLLLEVQGLFNETTTLTEQQFLEQMESFLSNIQDEALKESLMASQGLGYDENGHLKIIEAVEGSVSIAYEEAAKQIEALGIKNANNIALGTQQQILDTIAKANLSGKQSTNFGQGLFDFYNQNNFSAKIKGVLSSIDLTSSYSELLTNSQSYIDALQEAGMSSEQASKTFNEYISKARKYIYSAISNLEGVTVLREGINTNLSGMSEKYGSLLEAQKEYQENGALSSETYYKLLEAGFDKYVKITGKGYELLGEKVSEAYNQEALNQYSTYLASIEDQQRTINVLTDNKKIQKQYLDENGNTIDEGSYTLKELANYYKANSEELEKYTGDYKDLIQEFVNSDDNWEDYIQNLKNVKQEMEDQKSEVYIQSLHAITDAYDDAAKEIQELTDELADLTEQEEEEKKAKDEAYQAWQDAIHGSEDYQSSLDGLFNYEKRLDSLNDKLKETKEALSDISSIEEAKDLLQNTQSLYENKLGTLQAQNKVINQSIKNLDEEILKNYGDFVGFDELGNMTVDTRKLEDADMSDVLKDDGFTQLIEKRVEMKDKLDEGNKEILETEKAWNEQLKEAREGQIAIEEKVIDILKEKMQEEIDATNEKYAALKEADNSYLDALQEAIDKQRELRERENQYEDLATKQKKLSLMQRDTSGANQKEVQSLEKEIDEDRQGLLDSEVDNLIESMRELYEKQQEARELEIEAMEAATENMQAINETALNIISGFQTAEDYQAWFMENDTSVEDMTVTQTEAYLDEAKEIFSGYAQYIALTAEDMALRTDEINANADTVFENTSENITTIGTTIQDLAEAAADKAETEAKEAYDDTVDKWNKTQDKIAETTNKLNAAEASAISTHQSTMNALVDASQSGMADVAEFAVSELAALTGLDLGGDSKKVKEFLEEHNLITEDGGISQGVYNAITAAGGDTSGYTVSNARYSLKAVSSSGLSTVGQFATQEAAEAEKQRRIAEGSTSQYVIDKTDLEGKLIFDKHGIKWPDGQLKTWALNGDYEIFKTGGLVNYTGPAWVDGTPSKPEAFLSAQDTERIGNAAKLLADLPILNSTSNANNAVSSNIGDTSIEIHINVESLASDYDVDQMIERVKNDILDVSKPTGTSVILHK